MVCIEKRPQKCGRSSAPRFKYFTCLLDKGHIKTGWFFYFYIQACLVGGRPLLHTFLLYVDHWLLFTGTSQAVTIQPLSFLATQAFSLALSSFTFLK